MKNLTTVFYILCAWDSSSHKILLNVTIPTNLVGYATPAILDKYIYIYKYKYLTGIQREDTTGSKK